MKRYIKSAKTKPYTVTPQKLNKAVVVKDFERLVPFIPRNPETADRLMEDLEYRRRPLIEFYGTDVNEFIYAKYLNCDATDLKTLELGYIIDTQGHIDFAELSDNEKFESIDLISLSDAVRDAIRSILSDLSKYDKVKDVVRVNIYLSIYGYGNHCVELSTSMKLIYAWGEGRYSPSSEFRVLSSEDSNICIGLEMALMNDSVFKRQTLRDLRAALAEPIKNIR